jgi:hypothetical protein
MPSFMKEMQPVELATLNNICQNVNPVCRKYPKEVLLILQRAANVDNLHNKHASEKSSVFY